jgi:hypothetical protein
MRRRAAVPTAICALLVSGAALGLGGALVENRIFIDEVLIPSIYATLLALYAATSLIPRRSGGLR